MHRLLFPVFAFLLLASFGTAPAFARPTSAAIQPKNETVYITRTGKKFHRNGCRSLSRSKIPIKRADAIAGGYGACKVCRP